MKTKIIILTILLLGALVQAQDVIFVPQQTVVVHHHQPTVVYQQQVVTVVRSTHTNQHVIWRPVAVHQHVPQPVYIGHGYVDHGGWGAQPFPMLPETRHVVHSVRHPRVIYVDSRLHPNYRHSSFGVIRRR